jgi:MoaA/NifB/PqqE/SkfB family radical SAM enzyme
MKVYYLPTQLGIMLTDRCNANCSFCGEGNHLRWSDLPVEIAFSCIDQASSLGISSVGFTGGETLLRYADTLRCMAHAQSRGMTSTVVSNASYATDLTAGGIVAEDLVKVGVNKLWLSFDKDHLEFVPFESHVGAITGALRNGLEIGLLVCDRNSTKKDNDLLIQKLAGRLSGRADESHNARIDIDEKAFIDIRRGGIGPFGNAARLDASEFDYRKCSELSLWCSSGDIVVMSNGNIIPCCGFPMFSDDFFSLGNAKDTSLKVAIEKVNMSIIGQIVCGGKNVGLRGVIKELKTSKDPYLVSFAERKYSGDCDVCKTLFSDSLVKEFVLEKSKINRIAVRNRA